MPDPTIFDVINYLGKHQQVELIKSVVSEIQGRANDHAVMVPLMTELFSYRDKYNNEMRRDTDNARN